MVWSLLQPPGREKHQLSVQCLLRKGPTCGHTARKEGNQAMWQVCSSKLRYFSSFKMHLSSVISACWAGSSPGGHLIVLEEESEAQRGTGLVLSHTVGHRPVMGTWLPAFSPSSVTYLLPLLREKPASQVVLLRGSRLPRGLVLLWLHPLTRLPPLSSGVPRTIT